MTIVPIVIIDEWHPVEIQTWLDANPTVTIKFISFKDNLVYIFYE
jgi:hypothetical protein